MGGREAVALTLVPLGGRVHQRPLTLQFDGGSAAASDALRDEWLLALREAIAAARAADDESEFPLLN